MRRRAAMALAGVAVVSIGIGAVGAEVILDQRNVEAQAAHDFELRPVTVERTSLAQGTVFSGTLSRGAPLPLSANSGGIVTWLPRPGAVISKGDRLIESNGRPLFLLQGRVPLWRPLQSGDRGKDVRSLNGALADAGLLDRSKVDDVFGAGTSSAIAALFHQAGYVPPSETESGHERATQARAAAREAEEVLADARSVLADLSKAQAAVDVRADGGPKTAAQALADAQKAVAVAEERLMAAGMDVRIAESQRVTPEDVAILDVPELRVSNVPVRVGDPASGPVIEWTGLQVHAVGQVTRSQQSSLSAGDEVSVSLPDGSEVKGALTMVGGSGTGDESGAGEGEADMAGESESGDVATIRVALESQDGLAEIVGASVRIEVTSASVDDALVVPVTALIALAEGGYAVEKVMPGASPGTGALVPVEVGLVAEAKAQITSEQVREGDEVLVP